MKTLNISAAFAATLALGVTLAPLTAPVSAQDRPGGPGGGMRNSPKGRLGRLVMGVGHLEDAKKAPLSAAQAKTMILAIKPWRAKKTMTDEQAKGLYMTLNGTLTTQQKNELDKDAAKNRHFGPPPAANGAGGGNRGGGAGGFGGGAALDPAKMAEMRARMEKMRGFFKTYNPFYPPSGYAEFKSAPERMQQGMTRRYQRQLQLLQALAKKGGVKL